MAYIDAQGTVITCADSLNAAQTIGQVQSIGTFAPGTRTERDRTTLASTAKEWGYGLKDNGVFTITTFYDPTDAGQAELLLQEAATEAPTREWTVTFSNGEVHTFNGLLTESPIEVGVDTDLTRTWSVRITGAITRTP
jgi:hypothetical protein